MATRILLENSNLSIVSRLVSGKPNNQPLLSWFYILHHGSGKAQRS